MSRFPSRSILDCARDDSEWFLRDIPRRHPLMKDHTFTLGIEEEFAIIDPETRELR